MDRELLFRIKVNQNCPLIIICAHSKVGGLESIEYKHTIEAINLFVFLYQSATPSANLLRDSLELIQVEIGLDSPVLEADYKKFSYLVTDS